MPDAVVPTMKPKFMRTIAWSLLGILALLLVSGVVGWEYVKHSIRANERAPKLERVSRPEEDFAFRTLDGRTKRLSDFKGKTVFLDLWGTWCIQCVAEMPTVQTLYAHYRDSPDIVFLIVSRLDSPTKVRLYANGGGYDLPFYVMEDADIPQAMQLNQYPATFIFTSDGRLAAQHVGAADWSAPAVIHLLDAIRAER